MSICGINFKAVVVELVRTHILNMQQQLQKHFAHKNVRNVPHKNILLSFLRYVPLYKMAIKIHFFQLSTEENA